MKVVKAAYADLIERVEKLNNRRYSAIFKTLVLNSQDPNLSTFYVLGVIHTLELMYDFDHTGLREGEE